MGTWWGNQCTLLVCVAHSIPRGNIFLLFYYLNVNKLISFQSFAVVYPYDNIHQLRQILHLIKIQNIKQCGYPNNHSLCGGYSS